MSSDRTRARLADIIENADRIAAYVRDLEFTDFERDRRTQDAVERCLQRITEAAIRLGEGPLAAIAPDVPFHVLRGLGNMLRHEYDQLSLEQIWNTATDSVPRFRAACIAALG